MGRCRLMCPATVTAVLNLSLSRRARPGLMGWMTRLLGFTRRVYRPRDIRAHLEGGLWPEGVSRSYQPCDRRCPGGSVGLAEPRPGADVSDCFPSMLYVSKSATRKAVRSKTRPFTWPWASPPEGEREVLGLWIAANEGAKFWLSVMNKPAKPGR